MKFLEDLSSFRSGYDRDNFDNFLKKRKFSFHIPSVHIAGTNGKGSTANYLKNIYQTAGYKVGLFTSPYFKSPCECITVNNEPISEEEFDKYYLDNKKDFSKFDLSEFEIETYIAFTYFIDKGCNFAIIECGMGGEYDATNIFTPVLSIITSISLEHTSYLGRSASEIALHKAGIIKDKVPVLIHNHLSDEVLNVIAGVAKDNRTKVTQVDNYHFEKLSEDGYEFMYGGLSNLKIKTPALYAVHDACFAIEATKILKDEYPVSEESIRSGLLLEGLPGRFSIKMHNPLVIVDGAHNPEGVQSLVNDVSKVAGEKSVHVAFACFRDKNLESMLSGLNFLTPSITLTTFDHPRARTEDEYFIYLGEYQFKDNHQELIQSLIDEHPDDIILITGSLAFAYLVNDEFNRGIYVKHEDNV